MSQAHGPWNYNVEFSFLPQWYRVVLLQGNRQRLYLTKKSSPLRSGEDGVTIVFPGHLNIRAKACGITCIHKCGHSDHSHCHVLEICIILFPFVAWQQLPEPSQAMTKRHVHPKWDRQGWALKLLWACPSPPIADAMLHLQFTKQEPSSSEKPLQKSVAKGSYKGQRRQTHGSIYSDLLSQAAQCSNLILVTYYEALAMKKSFTSIFSAVKGEQRNLICSLVRMILISTTEHR